MPRLPIPAPDQERGVIGLHPKGEQRDPPAAAELLGAGHELSVILITVKQRVGVGRELNEQVHGFNLLPSPQQAAIQHLRSKISNL